MKQILSKQSQRFLTTLEYLYYNESSSFDHLAALSSVSNKTIREDINKINQFIKPLHIQRFSPNECLLTHKNNISCDFIYSCILVESLEFSVLELIFFEKENRLEDYADALFISLSTLKRIISKINKQIKDKGFEIATNPIQLVGDEQLICRTMVHFFREKYLEKEYHFTPTKQKVFDELIMSLINMREHFLNYTDFEKLHLIIYVSLIRMQNGHHYHLPNMTELENKLAFQILDNTLYKQAFKNLFKVELTKSHLIELTYPFSSGEFAFRFSELQTICAQSTAKQKKYHQTNQLVDDICSTLRIQLNTAQRESMTLDLFNVRFWTVAKTYLIYNYKHTFLMNLAKDFPLVYHFLYHKVSSHYHFKRYETYEIEEVIYILITHWDNLLYAIQDYYPKFKVGVCMNSDMEHIRFMLQVLNRKYDHYFEFETFVSMNDTQIAEKVNLYDLILTNVSTLNDYHPRVVSVALYPSSTDFEQLYKMYYELSDITINNKKHG